MDLSEAWRCGVHAMGSPSPCSRCGTFLCQSCRPGGRCEACDAREGASVLALEDESLPMWRRGGQSLLDLLLHPLVFFERAARSDRLDTPLALLTVVGALQASVVVAQRWLLFGWETTPEVPGILSLAVANLASPFVRTAFLAAFFHPLELVLKPGRHFRRTYRAVSWSVVFSLLIFIPTLGPGLSAITQLVFAVLGVRAAHPTARWALRVLGVVALLFCFVGFYRIFQTTK